MEREEVIATTCQWCYGACGLLVYLKDGKPIRVEGDPEHPLSKGSLCPIGNASLEYLNHPDRIKHPVKRAGKRGQGKWQRISWDEALDTIAAELTKVKDQYGAESFVIIRGAALGYPEAYISRFANLFGTPNCASNAHICYIPRVHGSKMTCGFFPKADYDYPPAGLVVWGVNDHATFLPHRLGETKARKKGARILAIDVQETESTRNSEIWIRPRPGSDLALALGMINVIINENLYDKTFVDHWTVGFDRLKTYIQDYTPEKVSHITWVPAERIIKAARFFAEKKPTAVAWGNGIDTNINNLQCARAITILMAITGNLGRPGGNIDWSPSGVYSRSAPELTKKDSLSPEARAKCISAGEGILPEMSLAIPQVLIKAMLENDPYPVRAAFISACNMLLTCPNAIETRNALESLDFSVVSEFFMTPTAEMADIVLPVATHLEVDRLHESQNVPVLGVIQKVAQVGECRSPYMIWKDLAGRLGFGHEFPDEKELLDYILSPVGLTFDEFRKVRVISGRKEYRKYQKNGFKTPSGKVELYSNRLKELGFDPLPTWHELPESPYSAPELMKEYPLVLTNQKSASYKHASGRQIPSLRKSHKEPIVKIHPETASPLGIEEGDVVYIETRRGRIKQKATLPSSIDPRVVIADFGWWYPEKESDLHEWRESNINVLTDNKPPYGRETGSATLKGILCKVYRASDMPDQLSL